MYFCTQVKLRGQIDWKIEDFLSWVAFQEEGSQQTSSVFDFYFPAVKKNYKFSILMYPKGEKVFWNNIVNTVKLGYSEHGYNEHINVLHLV